MHVRRAWPGVTYSRWLKMSPSGLASFAALQNHV
jgi:hypothetical protein